MRFRSLRLFLWTLLLFPSLCASQSKIKSEAEQDGFAGPVRSVSTFASHPRVNWQQPSGPTLAIPIFCWECEYDQDGTKLKSGQTINGDFIGEVSEVDRDGNGRLVGRRTWNASNGELYRSETFGAFGKTAETDYSQGKVSSQQQLAYDLLGHITEWLSFDGSGKLESRNQKSTSKDGVITEQSEWDKNGELKWKQTYDPETTEERFTTYDDSGSVKLTWTRSHDEMVSFWEQADADNQYGDTFSDDLGNGTIKSYHCSKNRPCEQYTVHYEYLSPDKRNLQSAEERDAAGNLVLAAYYEYDLDNFQNWTHRRVFVWTPESAERTLYEDDSRTITYWQK